MSKSKKQGGGPLMTTTEQSVMLATLLVAGTVWGRTVGLWKHADRRTCNG